MNQVFVEKMQIIDMIFVRFYVKNCQLVSLLLHLNNMCSRLKSVRLATPLYESIATCHCITKN